MDASIDTDIVIHLYRSGKKELLFSSFDHLYMFKYLKDVELQIKGPDIYTEFCEDVAANNIIIISDSELIEKGIKGLFDTYKRENECLFDSGELHAIALAKAMGIYAFVSDDTKSQGPHETLVKEIIEDVMPFSFYELLFLRYLSSELTVEQLHQEFEEVTSASMAERPMKFRSKILATIRRFSERSGTARDLEWMKQYCSELNIDFKKKVRDLKPLLESL